MEDVGLLRSLAQFGGAVDFAGSFNVFFVLLFDAGGIEVMPEGCSRVVAVFLQGMELGSQAAKDGEEAGEFFGVGDELAAVFGLEEELGDLGGGELEADFGELGGVVFVEMFSEVVLEEAGFVGAILFSAPFFVAATGFPVGDVALCDVDAVFVKGADDFGVGDIVAEHAVDHVAFEVGQPGDFAVACRTPGSSLSDGAGDGQGRVFGLARWQRLREHG